MDNNLDPDRLPTYTERFDYLTPEQRLIARLLYEGYNQVEIADSLLVSRATVARRVAKLKKLVREQAEKRCFLDEY